VVRAREDAGLDRVVPKVAKHCCCLVRTCATSIGALVIASAAPVAVFAGYVLQPLNLSSGHHPVHSSLVVLLCRAKMVLGLSRSGVAVEVGLLSVVARRRGPACHAANTSRAICAGFLCGPLNSAIENATVVFAGWVAWRRVRNVRKVDTRRRLKHTSLKLRLIYRTKAVVRTSKETRLSDGAMCQIGQLNQLCLSAIAVASSRQLATGWFFEVSECVVVPIVNRFASVWMRAVWVSV
jgi:hypothetical protein